MSDTTAYLILSGLGLGFVALGIAVYHHIKWLYREDQRMLWRAMEVVYKLRDRIRELEAEQG